MATDSLPPSCCGGALTLTLEYSLTTASVGVLGPSYPARPRGPVNGPREHLDGLSRLYVRSGYSSGRMEGQALGKSSQGWGRVGFPRRKHPGPYVYGCSEQRDTPLRPCTAIVHFLLDLLGFSLSLPLLRRGLWLLLFFFDVVVSPGRPCAFDL